MIRGTVIQGEGGGLEAWVEISVVDSDGGLHPIQAEVDTGFTGWLTLPTEFIHRLGLPTITSQKAALADGSESVYQYYGGRVVWRGRPRPFAIIALDSKPLLGTQALSNCRLTIDFQEGGDVIIEETAAR